MKNKAITSRDVDFAQWYTDVIFAAKLASYSSVKGCIVIEPNGYAIWENMQKVLDKKFKETGHQNVSLPLLIPENLMNKETELIGGFAPEVAWVTIGGQKELEERLCIRPTSETLFSDYYSKIVTSYRDLPKKYNQWCNVLRWEKETRPFLRSREFLWQEGHTIHETAAEAEAETRGMLEVYRNFFEEYLAIPVITGRKTEKEKFAGAEYTLTLEALMYNGVSLQIGTSHYFGQRFAKAYDIVFTNRNNEREHVYQTSWGVTTRMIGGLIMVHSDEYGLVLPPKIAPTEVVIIPIGQSEVVDSKVSELEIVLKTNGISVEVDRTERSPGFKFAEAEVKGIPIRIEVGERDLAQGNITIARRDTREKLVEKETIEINQYVKDLLKEIQTNLYNRAKARREELTYECQTLEEVKEIMSTKPGFIKAMWDGETDSEEKLKELTGIKSRCILEHADPISDICMISGKPAKYLVVWGIQY